MKITNIEILYVKPRWSFLKMSTDEGITGWGEAIVEGRSRTVAMAVKELEPHLIGQDPRRIEHHWQAMYRGTFYRGGPIMTSAIKRTILRTIHIVFAIPIAGYVYSPFHNLPDYAGPTRYVFFPVIALTGLWMWKGHVVRRLFSR